MARLARAWQVGLMAAALLAGTLAGCGSSPPIDQNYGSDLGADFRAPVTDASTNGDTNMTPASGAAGQSGAGGSGAAGAPGTGGQAGTDAATTGAAGAG